MYLADIHFKQRLDEWIQSNIYPYTENWCRGSTWPVRELVSSLAANKLLVAGWSAPFGDGDLRKQLYLHYRIAREAPGSIGLCITSHLDIGARCLLEKASPQLAEQWLPRALNGEALLALAMTEPQAGSDLQGIEFCAEKVEQGWRLTGIKRGITNLPFADAVIVLARTAPNRSPFSYSLFLLPMDTQGVVRENPLPTLGYPGCLGGIEVAEAILPEENVLGSAGAGLILLMQHMATERLFVSTRMLGISEYLLEKIQLAMLAKQSSIAQSTVQKLQNQYCAYKAYFEQCVENYCAQTFPAKDSASLKYLGCRLLKTLSTQLCELEGAEGFLRNGEAETYQREILGLSLAGGSEEIMLAIIANEL
jgi:acyl-CoA dehydrogenase